MRRVDQLREIIDQCDTDDCVIFPYAMTPKGYPKVNDGGRTRQASRLVCEWTHGTAPFDGAQAAHWCGVRACVNPRHIRWATAKENESDKIRHGTNTTGPSDLRKLDVDKARSVRVAAASGETFSAIGRAVGLTGSAVRQIVHGLTYRDADGPTSTDRRPPGVAGKLSRDQVDGIRSSRVSGESMRSIARRFGVDHHTVWNIVHGKTYTPDG
jgi:hypothetical protein